jgi:hypothetical protein
MIARGLLENEETRGVERYFVLACVWPKVQSPSSSLQGREEDDSRVMCV